MSSVSKALQILNMMAEPPYEFGVTEISERVGIVKSGSYKLLKDLVDAGFVVKNPKSHLYRLGAGVFRLGAVYSDVKGVADVGRNVMQAIVNATNQSVLIGLLEGDYVFLAYKLDAPGSFMYRGRVGRRFPFYAGALGKILGAYLEPEFVLEAIKREGPFPEAATKIPEDEVLLKQYEEIRKAGYVLSMEENIAGAFGLSVPIMDYKDNMNTACLCVAGPVELYDPKHLEAWLRLLREGAREISYKMGRR